MLNSSVILICILFNITLILETNIVSPTLSDNFKWKFNYNNCYRVNKGQILNNLGLQAACNHPTIVGGLDYEFHIIKL